MLKPSDVRFQDRDDGNFVVVNASRDMQGTAGPIVASYKSRSAAERGAKKDHRFKALELNKTLNINDHVNPQTDVIWNRKARFEIPNASKQRFYPSAREGGR
jgi:hypothetical protein